MSIRKLNWWLVLGILVISTGVVLAFTPKISALTITGVPDSLGTVDADIGATAVLTIRNWRLRTVEVEPPLIGCYASSKSKRIAVPPLSSTRIMAGFDLSHLSSGEHIVQIKIPYAYSDGGSVFAKDVYVNAVRKK